MRDNGLTAATYTSLGGIDPRVTTPVLDALAEAGIAAYCAPPENTTAAETADETVKAEDGDVTLPDSGDPGDEPEAVAAAKAEAPSKTSDDTGTARKPPAGFEEIFVDADAVERARGLIDRSTEDAEWKSLVEQFNAPSAPGHDESPVPRWPASEDVDDDSYEPLIDVPAGLIVDDTDDEPPKEPPPRRRDDPHDHYIPPEPPRGPRLDWVSRAAWLGLIGGPVLLVLAAVLDFGTGRITLLGVFGFMAGFLTLVIRMNDRLPPDDTPDDGAVV